MKFDPYPVLLTTGVLMFATVVFAQTRTSMALMKAGAVSVDRDVSGFTARVRGVPDTPARVAADRDVEAFGTLDRSRQARIAALVEEKAASQE